MDIIAYRSSVALLWQQVQAYVLLVEACDVYYRGDKADATVPLTKEAIRSAQLTYEGSFKDPEVLKHWSGSGNLR